MTQPPNNQLTPAEIAARLEALTEVVELLAKVYLDDVRRAGQRSERARAQEAKLRGLVNAVPRGPGSGQGGGQGAGGR